jgi:hypothetical protein
VEVGHLKKADSNNEERKKFPKEAFAFVKNAKAELEPFVKAIRDMPAESQDLETFRRACIDYFGEHKHYGELSQHVSKDILKVTGTGKDKLQWILWYLCVLEGINHTVVNVLIVLINVSKIKVKSANPEDNYFTKQIMNASSLDDLKRGFIPLRVKLSFLRANGLKEVASVIDAKFRNDVAHFNFDIHGDEIVVGDKKITPLIVENVHNLLRLLAVVSELLKKLAIEKGCFNVGIWGSG